MKGRLTKITLAPTIGGEAFDFNLFETREPNEQATRSHTYHHFGIAGEERELITGLSARRKIVMPNDLEEIVNIAF